MVQETVSKKPTASIPPGTITKTPTKEVWSKQHSCVVCCTVCLTDEDKVAHEKLPSHVKKYGIYKFFADEVSNLTASKRPSTLVNRYSLMNEKAIGLECIHELVFPFAETGWWACSICYESGLRYEVLDAHLRSVTHLKTYLEEFHPHLAAKLKTNGSRTELYEQLLQFRSKLFDEQDCKLLAPEVLEMNLQREDAKAKLVTNEVHTLKMKHEHPFSTTINRKFVVQCMVCNDMVPCTRKNLNKAWAVHENSPHHRHAQAIRDVLKQVEMEETECDINIPPVPCAWRERNGCHYGPVTGIRNLLVCGSDNYCLVCFCKVGDVYEHFSSENHICKYVSTKRTLAAFAVAQQTGDARRAAIIQLLSELTLENDKLQRIVNGKQLPSFVLAISNEEDFTSRECLPELQPLGFDAKCLVCEDCCVVIKLENNVADFGAAAWNEHVQSEDHFECLCRRAAFRFYDEFFVPEYSSVKLAPNELHGKWSEVEIEKVKYRIQSQCDIGLECIVEDEENDEVVCTLCARIFKRDSHEAINNHIRSYIHLHTYLNMYNRELLAILLLQTSEQAVQDLTLEWLQRNSKMYQNQIYDPNYMQHIAFRDNWSQIKVYSPKKAMAIQSMATVSTRSISLAYVQPEMRELINVLVPVIDKVCDDGVELESVDLRAALCVSPCRILKMEDEEAFKPTSRILIRCMTCQMVFTTNFDKIASDVWENHLLSDVHITRIAGFENSKLDMYGFISETSSYTVKPFLQKDPSKKVTWQWNANEKLHEFVLSVVGLPDLVERRTLVMAEKQSPDFFCRLCAVNFPKRAALLESHVRSSQHVMNYVHKYHPETVMQIEGLQVDDGGKFMRRCIAQLLKNSAPPSEYCIPVYDPVGEQERKGVVAMEKIQEEERQRQLEEVRKQAREQRMKREEERKAQREIELAREKTRREEREKLERGLREKALEKEEERNRLRQIALEAAQHMEEERKRAAEAFRQRENEEERARKEREQAHRCQILQKEKERIKALAERKRAEMLLQEKMALEKQMADLKKQQQLQQSGMMTGPPMMGGMPPVSMPPPGRMMPPPFIGMPMGGFPPPFTAPPSADYGRMAASKAPGYATKGTEDMDISRSPSPVQNRIRPAATPRLSLIGREVDPYIANPAIISTRQQLVDFIWRQGAERIPDNERPLLFNGKAVEGEGNVGIDTLYEVVCVDDPTLDTFYCSMCGTWNTPGDTLNHLQSTEHKLAFLFRNYKIYHSQVLAETNGQKKQQMIDQYALQIWRSEIPHKVVTSRLRSVLNREVIARCWPGYQYAFSDSWKSKTTNIQAVPAPVPKVLPVDDSLRPMSISPASDDGQQTSKRRSKPQSPKRRRRSQSRDTPDRKRKSSPDRKRRRSRSRSRDRSRRSRSRGRGSPRRRSRSPRKRSRSRSRDRPSKRRTPERKSKDDKSWSKDAAAFLEKLGDHAAADRVRSDTLRNTGSNAQFHEKLAQIRKFANPAPSTSSRPSQLPPVITLDDDNQKKQQQQPVDDKAEMRKLLGVLITMQQEAERTGNLDPAIVDTLYREVGLQKREGFSSDQLLAQLLAQLSSAVNGPPKTTTAIDLGSYGIGQKAPATSVAPYGVTQPAPSFQQPPPQQYGFNNAPPHSYNMPPPQDPRSLATAAYQSQQHPPVSTKPNLVINRTEDVYNNEEDVSYVYPVVGEDGKRHVPGDDDEKAKEEKAKKEKAALRKKMLLEQAEKLRKQAEEADDDDDDWDSLESEMNQMLAPKSASSTPTSNAVDSPQPKPRVKFGKPTQWAQPVPQPTQKKSVDSTPQKPSVDIPTNTTPIAPGQKMPLARTVLPNGKQPPSFANNNMPPPVGQQQQPPQQPVVPQQQQMQMPPPINQFPPGTTWPTSASGTNPTATVQPSAYQQPPPQQFYQQQQPPPGPPQNYGAYNQQMNYQQPPSGYGQHAANNYQQPDAYGHQLQPTYAPGTAPQYGQASTYFSQQPQQAPPPQYYGQQQQYGSGY